MASKRGKQTVRDMFLSMAVISAAAGVVYIFVPHDENANPVKPVDYRVELLTARRAAPYPVVAPDGLAKDWKPTSVSYDRKADNSWHLGFLDPEGKYVAVEQSTSPAKKYVTEVSQDARDTGRTQQVAGETWQHWKGEKYDALVRQDKGATTVVTGSASPERLAEMAAALKSS
ncbi:MULTISPECIES: DUF4245 domain-containing protein [unclassified Streptomyces]|uniref:DUF4245 domain-containing protein n=1 Tax=unclassified Streptomyces TaxID=2593676 RepID=UPI0033CCFCF5